MKKPLYITVLTAFALMCELSYALNSHLLLLFLMWIVEIAVLFAGEFIGIRAGRKTPFGEKYGENVGAAVSSVLILAAYLLEVLIVPGEFRSTALSVMYYPIGAAAVISLVINGGNIAAKKLVTFRARHGAPPSSDLTLKKFLPHLFTASGLGFLDAALTLVFFMLGELDNIVLRLIVNAVGIALRVQVANVIGVFINRLAEKRLANNILIAAISAWGLIYKIRFIFKSDLSGAFFPELRGSEIFITKTVIVFWAAVIAADIVWAVLKLRKGKTGIKIS